MIKPKLSNLFNSASNIPKFDIRSAALQYNIGNKKSKIKTTNDQNLFGVTVIFLPEKDNFKIPRTETK